MGKVTELGPADLDTLLPQLPAELRGIVRAVARPGVAYLALLFAHDRRSVVSSRVAERALDRASRDTPVLAIGGNFTVEALERLAAHGAVVARFSEFHWTDPSYQTLP